MDSNLKDRLENPTTSHVSQALAVDPQEIQAVLKSIRNRKKNPVATSEALARKVLPYALAVGLFVAGFAIGDALTKSAFYQGRQFADRRAVERAINSGEVVKASPPVGELSRSLAYYELPLGMSITVNGAKMRNATFKNAPKDRSSLERGLNNQILAMIGTYTPASGANSTRSVNMEEIAQQFSSSALSPFWKSVDVVVSYYIPKQGTMTQSRTIKTVDTEHPEVSPFVRKQLEQQARKIANELSFEFKKWEQKSP